MKMLLRFAASTVLALIMGTACDGLRLPGDTGAVHEHDLPDASLFLQESRFQPFLVHGTGRVGDAAFIGIRNPSGVTVDANIRFGHVPFITFTRGMLGLDEDHHGASVESGASIKYIKV